MVLAIWIVAKGGGGTSTFHDLLPVIGTLLGVVAGGVITAVISMKMETRRHQNALALLRAQQEGDRERDARADTREREREARAAVGAARDLRQYLIEVGSLMKTSVDRKIWWPERIWPDAVGAEDRKIVFAQLTPEEMEDVGEALSTLSRVETARALLGEDLTEISSEQGVDLLRSGEKAVTRAAVALVRVAAERT